MKYRMPTKFSSGLYLKEELELWQSGVLTGAILGFLIGLCLAGFIAVVVSLA